VTEPLFEVDTHLRIKVRTTPPYWQLLQQKHPEISGKLEELKQTLVDPESIHQSKQDKAAYLFYRPYNGYWLCAIVKKLNGEGFVITYYLTDKIKEGDKIWPG
jgi:hypothetical protein